MNVKSERTCEEILSDSFCFSLFYLIHQGMSYKSEKHSQRFFFTTIIIIPSGPQLLHLCMDFIEIITWVFLYHVSNIACPRSDIGRGLIDWMIPKKKKKHVMICLSYRFYFNKDLQK